MEHGRYCSSVYLFIHNYILSSHCVLRTSMSLSSQSLWKEQKNPVNSLEYVTGCAKCCEKRIKQVRKNGFFLSAIGSHSGEL